jgi:hypothetical protein
MRKLIVILLAVPLLQGCNQQRPGRFQIVAGTYDEEVNTDNPTSEEHGILRYGYTTQKQGIFKIDTQTGRTWMYSDVNNLTTNRTNPGADGWKEIKDLSTK